MGKTDLCFAASLPSQILDMAPKAAKVTAMSQSGITAAIATATGLKAADCKKVLASLAAVATKEVKSTGKFTVPGLAMLKMKPATKAGKREMFGKVVVVKAKPAKKVVKAFVVAALKKSRTAGEVCTCLVPLGAMHHEK